MEIEKRVPTPSATGKKRKLTIDDLDDDSLGMIFNKLPCIDRIRIENVCERWREVSRADWCLYSKRLILHKDMGNLSYPQANSKKGSVNLVEESLRRRGAYLEEIDFRQCSSINFKVGTIKRIAGFCPKLKRLHLSALLLDHEDWLAIGNNIEALSFHFFADKSGNHLKQLLQRSKKLRWLQFGPHPWCEASTFDLLEPGQLEFLKITLSWRFVLTDRLADKLADSLVDFTYIPMQNDYCYHESLRKLTNLESLNLQVKWAPLQISLIADIAENCRKLKNLTLALPFNYPCNASTFAPLFDLPCLRKLVLSREERGLPFAEEFTIMFERTSNLEILIIKTCSDCMYQEPMRVKPCFTHRKNKYRTS